MSSLSASAPAVAGGEKTRIGEIDQKQQIQRTKSAVAVPDLDWRQKIYPSITRRRSTEGIRLVWRTSPPAKLENLNRVLHIPRQRRNPTHAPQSSCWSSEVFSQSFDPLAIRLRQLSDSDFPNRTFTMSRRSCSESSDTSLEMREKLTREFGLHSFQMPSVKELLNYFEKSVKTNKGVGHAALASKSTVSKTQGKDSISEITGVAVVKVERKAGLQHPSSVSILRQKWEDVTNKISGQDRTKKKSDIFPQKHTEVEHPRVSTDPGYRSAASSDQNADFNPPEHCEGEYSEANPISASQSNFSMSEFDRSFIISLAEESLESKRSLFLKDASSSDIFHTDQKPFERQVCKRGSVRKMTLIYENLKKDKNPTDKPDHVRQPSASTPDNKPNFNKEILAVSPIRSRNSDSVESHESVQRESDPENHEREELENEKDAPDVIETGRILPDSFVLRHDYSFHLAGLERKPSVKDLKKRFEIHPKENHKYTQISKKLITSDKYPATMMTEEKSKEEYKKNHVTHPGKIVAGELTRTHDSAQVGKTGIVETKEGHEAKQDKTISVGELQKDPKITQVGQISEALKTSYENTQIEIPTGQSEKDIQPIHVEAIVAGASKTEEKETVGDRCEESETSQQQLVKDASAERLQGYENRTEDAKETSDNTIRNIVSDSDASYHPVMAVEEPRQEVDKSRNSVLEPQASDLSRGSDIEKIVNESTTYHNGEFIQPPTAQLNPKEQQKESDNDPLKKPKYVDRLSANNCEIIKPVMSDVKSASSEANISSRMSRVDSGLSTKSQVEEPEGTETVSKNVTPLLRFAHFPPRKARALSDASFTRGNVCRELKPDELNFFREWRSSLRTYMKKPPKLERSSTIASSAPATRRKKSSTELRNGAVVDTNRDPKRYRTLHSDELQFFGTTSEDSVKK